MDRLRALFVDDDEAIRTTFGALLEHEGFDTRLASSASEAAAALTEQQFELVVTDMRMETPIAGYDVVRAALAQSYGPVVVILTAYPLQAADWKREGAHAMFMKGGSPLTLLSEIRKLTESRLRYQARKAINRDDSRTARGTGT